MRKAIPFILVISVLLSMFSVPAFSASYSYEEPVEPKLWSEPSFSTDHAYSFAFVGDTQYLSTNDYFQKTKKMEQLYGIIADTAEERKLEQVFILGDITDMGYRNDANLAHTYYDPPITGEWENAQKAIFQLGDANVPYSICRGNHDDYMIDDYFNVPAYTDQFKDVGGFYSDSFAKHPKKREADNPDGYIYWSAVTGHHENSIVNSYRTAEICGNKYIFITVDFNPTENVVKWVDQILGEYSDHLAIVTTHSYLNSEGALRSSDQGDTKYPLGYAAEQLWDMALKNHENLLMVVCGHVGSTSPVYSTNVGVHGNKVHQFLVNPQGYDVKDDENGPVKGTQDTGLVLYVNFSADGSKITFDYYATLLNKEMKSIEDLEVTLYQKNPVKKVSGDVDEDGLVTMDDAIYILFSVNFPADYPLKYDCDYDLDGSVTMDDAIYLLFHVNFSEDYPLPT